MGQMTEMSKPDEFDNDDVDGDDSCDETLF